MIARLHRCTAAALVLMLTLATLALGMLGSAAPALALCTIPGTSIPCPSVGSSTGLADRTSFPAMTITDLVGAVLPEARATETMTYQLDQAAGEGSAVAGGIQTGVKIARFVPGFRLGYKLGGYIDGLLGIGGGDPQPRDPEYEPYAEENVQMTVAGWSPTNKVCGTAVDTGRRLAISLCATVGFGENTFNCGAADGADASDPPSCRVLPTVSLTDVSVRDSVSGGASAYVGSFGGPSVFGQWIGIDASGQSVLCGYAFGQTAVFDSVTSAPVLGSWGSTFNAGLGAFDTGISLGGKWACPNTAIVGMRVSLGGASSNTYQLSSDNPGRTAPPPTLVPFGTGVQGSVAQAWYVALDHGGPESTGPDRQWGSIVYCGDGTDHWSANYSAAFKETDTTLPPYPDFPTCTDGLPMTGWKIVLVDPHDGLSIVKTIESWTAPDTYKANLAAQPTCATTQCYTTLWKGGTQGTGWLNCFEHNDLCNGWADDPNRAEDYRCTYGPNSNPDTDTNVGLAGCYQYGPTFDPQQRAQGVLYSDPATDPAGGASAKNAPGPVVAPKAMPDPDSDTQPGSAGQALPGQDGASCWPSGWAAFNPAEWVLQPVKCALVWAFVPDDSIMSDLENRLRTALNGSGVGPWGDAIGGLFGKLGGSGSGCEGPAVPFPISDPPKTLHPFNACDQPMSTVAGIAYAFSTVAVVVFGAIAGLKVLGSAFGFHVGFGERLKAET